MKILNAIVLVSVTVGSISAQAWNGRHQRGPIAGPQSRPPFVAGPQYRPPVFRPPVYRPPNYQPPVYHRPPQWRPPVVAPPIGYPPPVLPPPIVEEPGYPVPNPIPDPIEEQRFYGLPPQIFVQEPCDPYQYQVPVVRTLPAQSVYCSNAYLETCSQMFQGYQVHPFNVRARGRCQIRPTFQGSLVLILNNSTVLAERQSERSIGVAYRNAVVMGICQ